MGTSGSSCKRISEDNECKVVLKYSSLDNSDKGELDITMDKSITIGEIVGFIDYLKIKRRNNAQNFILLENKKFNTCITLSTQVKLLAEVLLSYGCMLMR